MIGGFILLFVWKILSEESVGFNLWYNFEDKSIGCELEKYGK